MVGREERGGGEQRAEESRGGQCHKNVLHIYCWQQQDSLLKHPEMTLTYKRGGPASCGGLWGRPVASIGEEPGEQATGRQVQGFSSEIEFEKYVKYDYQAHKVLAAIVFDCDFKNRHDPLPLQVKYHLRFAAIQKTIIWPDETGWKTTLLFPNQPSVGPRNPGHQDGGGPGYIREGFLAIQHALDKAIILYHESSARQLFDDISIFVQRFPYPAYPDDGLLLLTGSFLPLMFILMFSPSVLSIIRSIVWEKEKRLKEYQLTIGLKSWMIWAAYFFTFFFFYIFIVSMICVLLFAKASVSFMLPNRNESYMYY
ncbi:phospholipid-transporting ATPase ABCA3-like [Bubalus kerabau]|uniref:phospholipid-transporting ATPase ABCA3-like n=1 Tax=Bubalus carabanensis TaxID=3119969 RepID=UPI00244E72C0|nr:phospholipid-transporting ATPase ABCA3-like [Bubalus carabanensis]